MPIPKFGDIADNRTLDGEKVKLDDILGKKIVVTGHSIGKSKFPRKGNENYLKIQFYFVDDETKTSKVFFSGSSVLTDQAEEMESKLSEQGLPYEFEATVKKVGNYYSFT